MNVRTVLNFFKEYLTPKKSERTIFRSGNAPQMSLSTLFRSEQLDSLFCHL